MRIPEEILDAMTDITRAAKKIEWAEKKIKKWADANDDNYSAIAENYLKLISTKEENERLNKFAKFVTECLFDKWNEFDSWDEVFCRLLVDLGFVRFNWDDKSYYPTIEFEGDAEQHRESIKELAAKTRETAVEEVIDAAEVVDETYYKISSEDLEKIKSGEYQKKGE